MRAASHETCDCIPAKDLAGCPISHHAPLKGFPFATGSVWESQCVHPTKGCCPCSDDFQNLFNTFAATDCFSYLLTFRLREACTKNVYYFWLAKYHGSKIRCWHRFFIAFFFVIIFIDNISKKADRFRCNCLSNQPWIKPYIGQSCYIYHQCKKIMSNLFPYNYSRVCQTSDN